MTIREALELMNSRPKKNLTVRMPAKIIDRVRAELRKEGSGRGITVLIREQLVRWLLKMGERR